MGRRQKENRRRHREPASVGVTASKVAAGAIPLVACLMVLLLANYRADQVYMAADFSRKTSAIVATDKEMWRLPQKMLGADADIYEYIQRTYPKGTHIRIDYFPMNGSPEEQGAAGRLARFRLALWPEYPDVAPYDLVLRVNFRVSVDLKVPLGPGEEIVNRGQAVDLVRRLKPEAVDR